MILMLRSMQMAAFALAIGCGVRTDGAAVCAGETAWCQAGAVS
jgi:hypothetical protein